MRDIARKLGISTSTVSRAFSKPEMVRPELCERILEMARELDYKPNPIARAMVLGQSDLIGLVVPDITNPFFPAIVRGAEDEACKHGLNLIVCNSDGHVAKEKQYLHSLHDLTVAGVIVASASRRDAYVAELAAGVPVVVMDRRLSGSLVSQVSADNYSGSKAVVDYLAGLGHRKLLYLSGPPMISTTEDRLRGFRDQCRLHHIDFDVVRAGFGIDDGYGAMKQAELMMDGTTGVVCANDLCAFGALARLAEVGIPVPERISVTGFDDIAFARIFSPSLTTVRQPTYEMGRRAVRAILDMRAGHVSCQPVVLPTELVVRDSTALRNTSAEHSSATSL
ncbi:LacI family DNA-binding transcriptional regulator [Candidatus Cryosericum septentrionale]|jgi:LacI family transcriptional regulator|uniref:LacI family transcriptional regulator n=1 Tax=Candidatus Cryosericum septentrionale TaxID=2290913 RepID=A0A398DLP8_9BACT|nr:LacI family DNA-binding transcriptional regulator [Candidatus Cryosericum septentrionale]RIE16095.1 LacI family transcriptional regulator [Candidatus Cryosericum septentrionale]